MNACVEICYRGEGNQGIHLLGPLARTVVRIAPPLVITPAEADDAMRLMGRLLSRLAEPAGRSVPAGRDDAR